jgi:hypothetical protein
MQIQEVCIDTVRSADTTINITEKQIFVQVPMKKDCTINYHTVSLIEPVTYETETVQVVRNKPNRQEPMTFDLPINSFLFVMATVMAVRYLATCSVSWANLINDLKHELNKA